MNIKKALAVICIAIAFCCVFGGFLAASVAAKPASSLQVSGYPASAGIGEPHDFTVTALDESGTTLTNYTGTVRFTSTDPEAVLPEDYSFSPGNSGSHTFSAVFNTPGTHSITVTDISDSSITGTQSGIIVKWDTSVTIQSSMDDSAYGDEVTFTANVSGSDGLTGTVTFYDGSNELGTANLASGQASYVSAGTELSAGSHEITARYNGDAYNNPGVSPTLTQNVSKRALTVSAEGVDKTYDGTAAAAVTLSDNRIAGDSLTPACTSASFQDKNVGNNKPITVSGITVSGADAGNYTWNDTASATANITPRVLTVTAAGKDRVYDGTKSATVTLSDNRIEGDVLTVSYTSASFADANAGPNKPVTVSGITVIGSDAGNYTWNTTANTTASVSQAASHITWDKPDDIIYPEPLGSAQLKATANVSGRFVYSPPAGTILDVGNNQTLRVTFTPDSWNYSSASASVNINVLAPGWKIVFTSSAQRINVGEVSRVIVLEIQDEAGNTASVVDPTLVNLVSSSGTGRFDTSSSGPFDGSINSITIPAGSGSARFYYKDTVTGTVLITASAEGIAGASQEETIVTPSSGGSGGGGGGSPSTTSTAVKIEGLAQQGELRLNKAGEVISDVNLTSVDGQVILTIPGKTKMLDNLQKPLKNISSRTLPGVAMLPPEGVLISACEFGPDGARFNPPLGLTMLYDPSALPEGVPEQSLYIGVLDGLVWLPLEDSQVDTVSHTVNARISHFSQYALIGTISQGPSDPEIGENNAGTTTPPPTTAVPISPSPSSTLSPAVQEILQPGLTSEPSPGLESDTGNPAANTENTGISIPVMLLIYLSVFVLFAGCTIGIVYWRRRSI